VLLAVGLPGLLRALDTNGDNLDDTWEAGYGFSTNAYASTNLVGWWQLNGTNSTDPAADRSGNGINGTLTNFPSVAYGAGLFSNALDLTTNGAVHFPTTNAALNATNQFTFSAWFQATNNLSQPATIATWSDASTNGWSVGVATNGVANVTFFDGATEQVVAGTNSPVNLYDGNWHQVAATYTTNQVATVYVDGTGEATNTITGWTPGTVSAFSFGSTNTGATNNPYALDEARLYNRAMTAGEVAQLPPTYSDLNGTGLSVFDDFLESLNPLSTTSIVTSGFISSGLTGYYGGSNPTLNKTGGDLQTISASTFATNALVVHVTNGSGTALVGAPITFSIPMYSDGGLSLTSGGTTTTSLSLTTDGSGNATVYYESGAEALQNNTIQATAVSTAGSVSVTFTEYCGVQSGLALWLRADQGVTQSSGNVSAWADQSINGNNASQSTSGSQPTLVTSSLNGQPVLRFNGSTGQYLGIADNSSVRVTNYTIISVINPGATLSSYPIIVSRPYYASGWTSPYDSYQFGITPSGNLYAYGSISSSSNVGTISSNVVASQGPILATGSYGSGVFKVYTKGSQVASTTVSNSPLSYNGQTANLVIGAATSNTAQLFYNGDIGEVLIYNRVLSSTEQQQAEAYLADKYGLYHPDATWPSAYSSAVQSEITRNQWNKSQADAYVAFLATSPAVPPTGLVTWLKADTGVTSSSGKVSQWADQSPAGNNAVQSSSGNQPTLVTGAINSNPALSFDGSSSYLTIADGSSLRSSNISILAVATRAGGSDYSYIVSKPYYNGSWSSPFIAYQLLYDPNGVPYTQCTVSGSVSSPATLPAAVNTGQPYLLNFTYDGTTESIRQNGGTPGTTSISGSIDYGDTTSKNVVIGQADGGYFLNGQIAEVLIYNRALTDTERQQAEAYLANKYGLPYYGSAPTISPNGGSYSGTQSVTLTSNQSVGTLHYTLDGTEPTASSPTYTGSFSLTGSALVSAAVFSSSGQPLSSIGSAQFYVNDTGSTGLPTAPTSLSTTVVSNSEIDLSWSLSGQVNYYGVYVYRSSDGGSTYQLVAALDPSATSYADTNVVAGTNYQYIVGTDNTSGESDTSATTSVTPSSATTWTITLTTPSGATTWP